jgi:hypothetical protein
MGGTRFIGVYLTKILAAQGHEVVLFNRGNKPVPVAGVKQIQGDRTNVEQLQEKLSTEEFDAVFDNNGRELSDTKPLAEIFKGRVQHFVYMSSAGVYLKSDQMPHIEGDATDPKSRHLGKCETENYLAASGLPGLRFARLTFTGHKIITIWRLGFSIALYAIDRFRFPVTECTSRSWGTVRIWLGLWRRFWATKGRSGKFTTFRAIDLSPLTV